MPLKLFPIERKDCKNVWFINNDPSVRKVSFSQQSIPYNDHVRWFKNKLSDKNSKLYKCVNGNEIVGLVRLDLTQKNALVSIAVRYGFRGKGVGTEILRMTIILAKDLKLKKLLAEIKQTNQSSLKLFDKLGFLEKETVLVNKEKVTRLELNV